jgi:hypothetical protein
MFRNALADNNDSDHDCAPYSPLLGHSCTLLPVQKNKFLGVRLFSSWLPVLSTRNRLSRPGHRSSSDRERVGLCSSRLSNASIGKIHSRNPTMFHHAVPDLVTKLESNATMAPQLRNLFHKLQKISQVSTGIFRIQCVSPCDNREAQRNESD